MDYKNLYVLGDSLSDTGALVGALSGLLDKKISFPAPFFRGRSFSNGMLAVECLAAQLGLPLQAGWSCMGRDQTKKSEQIGNNYAVSNARASAGTLAIYEFFFNQFQLKNQLATLMKHHLIGEDDLFIIMIGGNDLFSVLNGEPDTRLKEAVDEIVHVLVTLANNNAKHVVLANAPNIGITPLFINTPQQALATQLASQFNQSLKVSTDNFSSTYPAVQLKYFDLLNAFADITYDLGKNGYNTTKACLSDIVDHKNVAELLDILLKGQLGDVAYIAPCSQEKICDYVFFDRIHPTAAVHRCVGERFYNLIRTKEYAEVTM